MNCPIPLTVDYVPAGSKNRPGYTNPFEYVTIHNSGNRNAGANAKAHQTYLKSASAASSMVSWHFTVDDVCAVQHLPLNETGFHAGDGKGPGNRRSVGIEICMHKGINQAKANENAAKLTAWLLDTQGLSTDRVKQHYHWSGKNCPELIRAEPNGWNNFIAMVEKFRGGVNVENIEEGSVKAVVTAELLRIRKGPSTATTQVGSLVRGDVVYPKGVVGDWYLVNFKNGIGDAYIHKGYTEVEKVVQPVPEAKPDVPWYNDAQWWVKDQGIADGTRPTEPVTRAEVWQMFYNAHKKGLL